MSDSVNQGISIEQLKELADREPVSMYFGIKTIELSPGYAKISMQMKPEYLNFNGRVFGGMVAVIADKSFSMAVTSVSYPAVGTSLNIHLINGVEAADELVAECRVIKNGKRLGFTDVTVFNQAGTVIAKASGTYVPLGKKSG